MTREDQLTLALWLLEFALSGGDLMEHHHVQALLDEGTASINDADAREVVDAARALLGGRCSRAFAIQLFERVHQRAALNAPAEDSER